RGPSLLHPFPTRRSSDLWTTTTVPLFRPLALVPGLPKVLLCYMADCRRPARHSSTKGHRHATSSRHSQRSHLSCDSAAASGSHEDRKSTRLNSSHEWISY